MEEANNIIIDEPYGFIYITTNLINGKRYLGQKRFDTLDKWKAYLGSGHAFKKALKKYGKENFSRNIIFICYSEEELNRAEYNLSVFLDVVVSEDWYNLSYGGGTMQGYTHTEETRKKLSEFAKTRVGEKNPNYGKHTNAGESNYMYGKHHTEEARRKIRESQRRTKHIKPVVQLTLNREFIMEYESVLSAEKQTGIDHSSICACCKNRKNRSIAGGFRWIYKEDYDKLTKQNDLNEIK